MCVCGEEGLRLLMKVQPPYLLAAFNVTYSAVIINGWGLSIYVYRCFCEGILAHQNTSSRICKAQWQRGGKF